MPRQQQSLADMVQVLDSGITLGDILYDLGWVRKERERQRNKEARKRQRTKQAKEAPKEPTASNNPGNPAPE